MNEQLLTRLHEMKLSGMAETYKKQLQSYNCGSHFIQDYPIYYEILLDGEVSMNDHQGQWLY